MSSGGAAAGKRGASYERELVNRFDAAGWGALRLPSSGSATDRELPDVLAGYKQDWRDYLDDIAEPFYVNRSHQNAMDAAANIGRSSKLVAVELKSGKATTLYVEADEVDALEAFARRWGATPLLGARFTTQGSGTETYLVPPERARGPTDGGRYGLPVADIEERAAVVVSDGGVQRRD